MHPTRVTEYDHPPALTSVRLGRVAHLRHGFFTRQGGVSTGALASLNCSHAVGDTVAHWRANHARVGASLGARVVVSMQQEHGRRVCVVDAVAAFAPQRAGLFVGDGLVTRCARVAIGVLTADCVPVLLADEKNQVIGVAHAGWRGALAGVTDEVVAAMVALGACSHQMVAALGPAIQCHSYAVADDFYAQFQRASTLACADCFVRPPHRTGWHFDLPRYVTKRLRAAGVRHIDRRADDTYRDPARFFSHRHSCHHQQPQCGRQIAAICITLDDHRPAAPRAGA